MTGKIYRFSAIHNIFQNVFNPWLVESVTTDLVDTGRHVYILNAVQTSNQHIWNHFIMPFSFFKFI